MTSAKPTTFGTPSKQLQRKATQAVYEYNKTRTQADQARARAGNKCRVRWELGATYTPEQAASKLGAKA